MHVPSLLQRFGVLDGPPLDRASLPPQNVIHAIIDSLRFAGIYTTLVVGKRPAPDNLVVLTTPPAPPQITRPQVSQATRTTDPPVSGWAAFWKWAITPPDRSNRPSFFSDAGRERRAMIAFSVAVAAVLIGEIVATFGGTDSDTTLIGIAALFALIIYPMRKS